MEKPRIDPEEKDLIESFDRGEWRSIKDFAGESQRFKEYKGDLSERVALH
jgi:hypothetical protein